MFNLVKYSGYLETSNTSMIVGTTGAGETLIIDLFKDKATNSTWSVVYFTMNPKAQGLFEHYGIIDAQTR